MKDVATGTTVTVVVSPDALRKLSISEGPLEIFAKYGHVLESTASNKYDNQDGGSHVEIEPEESPERKCANGANWTSAPGLTTPKVPQILV